MSETQTRPVPQRRTAPPGYANILVHVEPMLSASHRTEVAAALARDLDAHLIGLGAEAIDVAFAADPYGGLLLAEWMAAAKAEIVQHLQKAEEAFRRDAAGVDLEWRGTESFPTAAVVQAARTADLVVMGPAVKEASNYRTADPADVVLSSGRPVLIVPEAGRHLRAANVVVAWKDTREARRALSDALPFLLRAERVIVQAVCAPDDVEAAAFQVNEVVSALERRGVAARPGVVTAHDDDVAKELYRVAEANDADLIVAGAYGHSRLAEWAFGGVTDELLHRPRCFVLMSH